MLSTWHVNVKRVRSPSTHVDSRMAKFVSFLLAAIWFSFISFISATLIHDGFTSMYDLTFHTRHEDEIMNELYAAFNCNEDSYPTLVHHVISGPLPKPSEDNTPTFQLIIRFEILKRLAEGLKTVPDLPPIFHVTLLVRTLQVLELFFQFNLDEKTLEKYRVLRNRLNSQVLKAVLNDMDQHRLLLSDRDKSYEGNKYKIHNYLSLGGSLKLGRTDSQARKYHPPPRELHEAALQLLFRRFRMLDEAILAASVAGREVFFEKVKDNFLSKDVSTLFSSSDMDI